MKPARCSSGPLAKARESASQVQLGPYGPILHVSVQTETELRADGAHLVVLRQHRRAQPPQFLIASHRNETTVQFCTQPQVLESVMDEHRQLGLVAPVQLTHATHCYDLRRPACILRMPLAAQYVVRAVVSLLDFPGWLAGLVVVLIKPKAYSHADTPCCDPGHARLTPAMICTRKLLNVPRTHVRVNTEFSPRPKTKLPGPTFCAHILCSHFVLGQTGTLVYNARPSGTLVCYKHRKRQCVLMTIQYPLRSDKYYEEAAYAFVCGCPGLLIVVSDVRPRRRCQDRRH